jgi:hypothetical protein
VKQFPGSRENKGKQKNNTTLHKTTKAINQLGSKRKREESKIGSKGTVTCFTETQQKERPFAGLKKDVPLYVF